MKYHPLGSHESWIERLNYYYVLLRRGVKFSIKQGGDVVVSALISMLRGSEPKSGNDEVGDRYFQP